MFKHVKLNESVLPKSLGVKGKNQNGIRYYTIDGVNMPSVTSILVTYQKEKKRLYNGVKQLANKWLTISL